MSAKCKILFLSLLCFATLLSSANEKSIDQSVKKALADKFYNPENKFWVGVDLIYAKAREKSLVLTNHKCDLFTTDDFTKSAPLHPHFDWDFGYRIGMGYLFPPHMHHALDISMEWMHYHTRAEQHELANETANIQGMFPIWSLSDDILRGDYVTRADLNWGLTINMLDLALNYSLHYKKRIEMKSFVGLRSGWIKQRMDIDYKGGIFLLDLLASGVSLVGTDTIAMKNNFWGLGPIVGVCPRYILCHGIRLYVDTAISGLCGYYSLHQKETYLEKTRFYSSRHPVQFRWIGDLGAGAYWKTFLYKTTYPVVVKLGWEYHIFFNQMKLQGDAFGLVSDNRNLELQGVTLSTSLDF